MVVPHLLSGENYLILGLYFTLGECITVVNTLKRALKLLHLFDVEKVFQNPAVSSLTKLTLPKQPYMQRYLYCKFLGLDFWVCPSCSYDKRFAQGMSAMPLLASHPVVQVPTCRSALASQEESLAAANSPSQVRSATDEQEFVHVG